MKAGDFEWMKQLKASLDLAMELPIMEEIKDQYLPDQVARIGEFLVLIPERFKKEEDREC